MSKYDPLLRHYDLYSHTLVSSYEYLNLLSPSECESRLPALSKIRGLSSIEVIRLLVRGIRSRLDRVDQELGKTLLDNPRCRVLYFNNRKIVIPLINQQAVEWYEDCSPFNFDFLIETQIGLHENAKVIFDIGGHQGIWAAYYATLPVDDGIPCRVWTFEPSIINVESSALLFLINGLDNVINVPAGIGVKTEVVKSKRSDALVDLVTHDFAFLALKDICWERPDFVKIDIEGFEYELAQSFPRIFDICPNIHLELHIPHLQNRCLDYREVLKVIPWQQVDVLNWQGGSLQTVTQGQELDGFCSLLIRRRAT